MKYLFNISLLIACLSLTLFSCKKDEHRIYFEGGTAPVLTASLAPGSQIPLSYDERENPVITLDWTNPAYKFTTGVSSQDVTYSLEVDTASVNFASGRKKTIAVSKDLSYTFTVGELNTAFISQLKLDSTKNNMIEMRVIASIGGSAATVLVSNILSFIVKPYSEPEQIDYLWVPGSYQGWDPGGAPRVGSKDGEAFEGYVNFPDPNVQFKFTNQPDWNGTNYGDGGGNVLSPDGAAGNLTMAEAGFYRLKPNIETLTWAYEKVNWAMIGNFNGWATDAPLTYNAVTGKLEIASIALTEGGFKFRANNGWDLQFGFDASTPGILSYAGSDLQVPESGDYKVELDLRNPLQYTYQLTKL